MQKEIIINATDDLTRIAITEDGKLAELFVESDERERMVGDIYFGTVMKVMAGIRAAFVDIGLDQDAFLHFSDVGDSFRDYGSISGDDRDNDAGEDEEGGESPKRNGHGQRRSRQHSPVLLQRGQELIVQIFKEPVGAKGVRVTTEVSLPGRFLVLMPYDKMIGASRKISNFKEKRRLRRIVQTMLPPGFGAIIRTVAEGKDEDVLRSDLQSLIETWREIERTIRKSHPPALIHKDMDASASAIRDLFSEDVTRVAVDSRSMYRDIRAYVNLVAPQKVNAIEMYSSREPIFDHYGVEKLIEQSLNRKVWLKSGGYLIIEHTEAMKVIDVNSGRYAAKSEQELNSLRTNLEAVQETARQIRLRDLGGIIVIDFIDMDRDENNRKVFEEMRREMRRDRAKFTILPLSDFGVMQITRQRVRDSVQMSISESCPSCNGTGLVQSKSALLTKMERWLRRFRNDSREMRLLLHVHPGVATFLTEGAISHIGRMMLKFFVRITVTPDPSLAIDEFRFLSKKRKQDITGQFLG